VLLDRLPAAGDDIASGLAWQFCVDRVELCIVHEGADADACHRLVPSFIRARPSQAWPWRREVQERMGHSDVVITINTYLHLFPREHDKKELSRAGQEVIRSRRVGAVSCGAAGKIP
jgi:hypothetical protein